MRSLVFLLAAACIACTTAAQTPPAQIERAFVIPDPAFVPEGIAHDPSTRAFFVGSTWQRRIVRIGADGAQSDFTPRDSDALLGVLGMQVDAERRLLWAAHASAGAGMPIRGDSSQGRSGLALFDLDTGRLIRNLVPPDDALHFLNDIALASDGSIYVTDSMTGTIYRADPDATALTPLVTLPSGGNGIALTPNQDVLYVAGAGGGAFRVDIATRSFVRLSTPEGIEIGADGFYLNEGDLIAVQPWSDQCRVCRFALDETGARIVSQRALATTHADFSQPTTGVIVGGDIYVIANAQLQHFRRLWTQHQGEPPRETLHDIVILRIPLN
jgi:sugar lactone lactonase YvrE